MANKSIKLPVLYSFKSLIHFLSLNIDYNILYFFEAKSNISLFFREMSNIDLIFLFLGNDLQPCSHAHLELQLNY